MDQDNSLNLKLSNLQLNKLKSSVKNKTSFLGLSPNAIGNSDDKTNFPHELSLTNSSPRNLANLSGAQKCCPSCHYRRQCDSNFTKHFHISVEELYILKTYFLLL